MVQKLTKVGFGLDKHKIIQQECVIHLAGKAFKSSYQIQAHSDGDLILHALSNAILSAIGLNDIGYYFSDKDEKNKDLDSKKILFFALDQLNKANYTLSNVTIILESDQLIINPIKPYLKNSLMNLLKISDISIHGTRSEQNSEISCCYVTILISFIGDK